ncbi:hypothetical protein SAMN05661093_06460 [Kibdelosporangium aridum]|uniref:Uncharacterized protein n=1 Tax=Kibdelosporangium aridum TaxID=2030 RepID=A0A1W2FFR7_KIBAR|nr:hypothetical protein SAMN05661093_06460 [Kibdelosporangium aridum]
MYWRTTLIGAPPTDPAKYDPDHNRTPFQYANRRSSNSLRNNRLDTPLRLLTSFEIAILGGK